MSSQNNSANSEAARKFKAFVQLIYSSNQVIDNPLARSYIDDVALNKNITQDARQSLGDSVVHVDRVLEYFRSNDLPDFSKSRNFQKNDRPCTRCIARKSRVCASPRVDLLSLILITISVSCLTCQTSNICASDVMLPGYPTAVGYGGLVIFSDNLN